MCNKQIVFKQTLIHLPSLRYFGQGLTFRLKGAIHCFPLEFYGLKLGHGLIPAFAQLQTTPHVPYSNLTLVNSRDVVLRPQLCP